MRRWYWKWLWLTLSVVWIGFIFSNSIQPAQQSDGMSGPITQWLQSAATALFGNGDWVTSTLVRKTAHFVEYMGLGILLYQTARGFWGTRLRFVLSAAVAGLLTASVDETIQLFVEGRSGQLTDVALDFCGVLCGVWLLYGMLSLLRRNKWDQ